MDIMSSPMTDGTDPVSPVPDGTPQPPDDPTPGRPTRKDRWPALLLTVLVLACSAMLAVEYKKFSMLDEVTHYDYITRMVNDHRIPGRNEEVSRDTVRALACYGTAQGRVKDLPCDAPPSVINSFHGQPNTSGGYPPVFFGSVAAVAAVISPFVGNLFIAARLGAALWLALGAVAAYLLARAAGARRIIAFALASGAALAPFMLFQGSTVNPDAASMLCGAGSVLAWWRWRNRTGWKTWLALAAVMLGVCLVKANLLPVPMAIAAAELTLVGYAAGPKALLSLRTWSPRSASGRVVSACATGVFAGIVWSVVFLMIMAPAQDVVLPAAYGTLPWSWPQVISSLLPATNPLSVGSFFFKVLGGSLLDLLAALLGLMALVGAVAASTLHRGRDLVPATVTPTGVTVEPARAIGYVALWSMVLAAPVTYAELAATHHFFVYPNRYSLWIVPIGLAALAGLVGRRSGLLIAALGLAVATVTTVQLIGGLPV